MIADAGNSLIKQIELITIKIFLFAQIFSLNDRVNVAQYCEGSVAQICSLLAIINLFYSRLFYSSMD